MIYRKILFLGLLSLAFLTFAPKAHAQDFNTRPHLKNWAAIQNPVINNLNTGAFGSGSTSSTNLVQNCQDNLFKFQTNNLFVGTFCDLGSIVAISTADFATNVTCSIQKVAMSNYDNSISFNSDPTNICEASHTGTGGILNSSGTDIFGTGNAAGDGTGFYANGAMSQLSNDINPPTGTRSWIRDGYNIVRNFASVLAFIFLLIFAFANILHFDINTYTIKKMIPNLIIALLGAYLSIYAIFLISRGVDFLYRLEFFSPYNMLHPFYNIMGGNFGSLITNSADQNVNALDLIFKLGGQVLGSTGSTVSIISGILGVIFLSIPAIVVFAFEYVMALRPLAVGLLVIASPVAFAAYVFPTGQNIFKKWITITLIALFYAPAANLILYVVNQLPISSNQTLLFLLLILTKTAVFALLIRMPFTIETDIQKISVALASTSLGNSLGLGKGNPNIKVKQDNRNTLTDKILESKAAKSLIAPISNTYRRDLTSSKVQTDRRRSFSQMLNTSQSSYIRNLDEVSDKAHKNNLGRSTGLLVNSIVDLSPQALRKIVSSSYGKIFRDTPLVNELKIKNGQLLDDEGAVTRADAGKKLFRSAQLVEQGKVGNPEAVRLLAQKQMLDILPLDILRKSLEQGILSKEDIRANFQGNPDAALARISQFNRGRVLNYDQMQQQIQIDYKDSKTGFTDLVSAIGTSLNQNPATQIANSAKSVETLKNQNQSNFDQNGMYYLSRLNDVSNGSKDKLATALKQAGTPAQTAIALSQNPALNYDQITSYVPKTASPDTLSMIKESLAERNSSQAMIGQIYNSLKEDKSILGRTVAEKVSESFKQGSARNFDDVKGQIATSLKNLSSTSSPQEVKTAVAQLNTFAPVATVQTATAPTSEEISKIKAKGEAVISTIDEMKMAGVDEKSLMQNPQAAAQQYSTEVEKTINKVATGQSKPAETTGNLETPSTPSQVNDVLGKVISTDGKGGSSFTQKLSDIGKVNPSGISPDQPPASKAVNSNG